MAKYHESMKDASSRPTRKAVNKATDIIWAEIKNSPGHKRNGANNFFTFDENRDRYRKIMNEALGLHLRAFQWVTKPIRELAEKFDDKSMIAELNQLESQFS